MQPRPVKRLFGSVFTRLLIVTLAAGLAITFTLIVGFMAIRFHSESAFERHLLLYTEYLAKDLGVPPDEDRARSIARRTGMASTGWPSERTNEYCFLCVETTSATSRTYTAPPGPWAMTVSET